MTIELILYYIFQTRRWTDPNAYIWNNDGLRALFIIQRTGKVLLNNLSKTYKWIL